MNQELMNLGQRAQACNLWGWMEGMLIEVGYRVVWIQDDVFRAFNYRGDEMFGSTDSILVDLSDAATIGCLLSLVRLHGGSGIRTAPVLSYGHDHALMTHGPRRGRRVKRDGWAVYGLNCTADLPVGDTEAEALVVALQMLSDAK